MEIGSKTGNRFKTSNKIKTGPRMTHFQLFHNAPAPRPPGTLPPSKIPFVRFKWCQNHPFSSKWHPSYAHLKFQILTFLLTLPKKHVWALWESPRGGKEIFFFSFSISFFRGFDHRSFSFLPRCDLNVLESSDRTKGWPPNGVPARPPSFPAVENPKQIF